MSGKVRSRCHDNAKPMSRYCEADVKANAKPMSGLMRSRCHDNAKPMSRRSRSRCQDECEADVRATAKPTSRRHSHAHTPNGSAHVHNASRASWVGTCPVRVGWERVPSELGREADIKKAFTRAHAEWKYTRTQTNCRQVETHSQICFIYVRIDY